MSGPSSGAGSGASGSAGALEGGRPGPCLVAGAVML
ncbi:MAG: hypothetical protein QOC83_1201, partial [Pseudonocardiales bacterium]|nr:hypothetical protein [Pseudonocardiales bacterium]